MTDLMTTPLSDLLVGLSPAVDARKAFLAGATKLSYGELRDGVARSRGLLARLGCRQGDRVAIATGNTAAICQLYGACLLSGCVAVVIDPGASAAEINVLLAKAKVSAVFADLAVIERASALQSDDTTPVITVAEAGKARTNFGLLIRKKSAADNSTYPAVLAGESPVEDRVEPGADAPALILFTSGTTSQPKGVVLTRANLAAQLATFPRHYGYSSSSVIANHLPFHHSDGLNQGPLLAFALGSTVLRPAPVNLQTLGDMLDLIHREKATHLVTVPTVIAMMTRLPDSYDDAFAQPAFEFISSTAGFLDEEIWRTVEDRFSTMVVNSYGLTETVMEAIYCGPTPQTRRIGTIGKPVDCEARIVDEDGHDVTEGATGELWLRGANVMAGYFELPDATAEVLLDGWLRTGDLAQCVDGFYRIVGRKKNVIIQAGTNVYPEDINAVLLADPSVTGVATIGLPDPFLGEQVVSCVTLAAPDRDAPTRLQVRCREHLAAEKVPGQILVFDELPYGPSGKIELAKVAQAAADLLGAATAAGGSATEQVLALASRVFGDPVDSLSPQDGADAIDGWDSLSFLEFVMSIERQFSMTIAPRDVMNLRTLADAISIVEGR